MPDVTIRSLVNPLAFLDVDEPWAASRHTEVRAEHILSYLCNPGDPGEIADLLARYRQISVEEPRLIMAPAEEWLLARLIWPLRQAKGCFMLGHFLATVSLCGMVAEMAAILTFDMGNVQINGRPMDVADQKSIFGGTFEKQGQERRVAILAGYGLVDCEIKKNYDCVRLARRRYLHLWSASHEELEREAIACFTASVKIVVATLGLSVRDGRLVLKQEVFKYLTQHGAGPEAAGGIGA